MKKLVFSLAIMAGSALSSLGADTPTFPGGETALNKFITEHTVYPQAAKENGVEGVVTVGFLVMPDGTLSQLKVVRLIDPDLEKEALRVVGAMPAWIPAEKDGTPVEAPSSVDIPFILE